MWVLCDEKNAYEGLSLLYSRREMVVMLGFFMMR